MIGDNSIWIAYLVAYYNASPERIRHLVGDRRWSTCKTQPIAAKSSPAWAGQDSSLTGRGGDTIGVGAMGRRRRPSEAIGKAASGRCRLTSFSGPEPLGDARTHPLPHRREAPPRHPGSPRLRPLRHTRAGSRGRATLSCPCWNSSVRLAPDTCATEPSAPAPVSPSKATSPCRVTRAMQQSIWSTSPPASKEPHEPQARPRPVR